MASDYFLGSPGLANSPVILSIRCFFRAINLNSQKTRALHPAVMSWIFIAVIPGARLRVGLMGPKMPKQLVLPELQESLLRWEKGTRMCKQALGDGSKCLTRKHPFPSGREEFLQQTRRIREEGSAGGGRNRHTDVVRKMMTHPGKPQEFIGMK